MAGKPRHGMHNTPEHLAWRHMKDRCFNPRSQRYDRYGARGIIVCERWLVFENFLEDMGRRPSPEHSIERLDNDGHYEPLNCVWATRAEQNANKSTARKLSHKGETLTVAEWSRRKRIGVKTLLHRLDAGWPVHLAIELPVGKRTWTKSPAGPGRAIPRSHGGPRHHRPQEVYEAIRRERAAGEGGAE